ncbi:MAG: DUF2064 domain-containing protein [Elusimicrobiaceae bacterium]|jgi:glycosyltransferase A (GT-A) superfamily protein (DUF2064 family)
MRSAIIFFAQLPDGKGTKHPLSAEIGRPKAVELLELFHEDYAERLCGSADIIVCYEPAVALERYRVIFGDNCRYAARRGGTDGEKIDNVFRFAFEQAYDKVLAVGVSCPDLPTENYGAALSALNSRQACAEKTGPDECCLFGLTRKGYVPGSLDGIKLGDDGGFENCVSALERHYDGVSFLPDWPAVRTAADIRALYRRNFDSAFTGSKTFAYLRGNSELAGAALE